MGPSPSCCSTAVSHHTQQRIVVELCGRHPFWRFPGEFSCLVWPRHTTAACDFIIPVGGLAIKLTIGGNAHQIHTPVHPTLTCSCIPAPCALCMNLSSPRSADHLPSASCYTSSHIHLDTCVNIYVRWVQKKIASASIPLRRLRS